MKKMFAAVMVLVMMLAFGVTAFAEGQGLTLDQAKQAALDFAGVRANDATFTKAYQDWDDGRLVYEIEFYANGTEYDMNVDVNTGRITDFSTEYHGGYTQPTYNSQPTYGTQPYGGYGDWDDMYDHDWDDVFDDWFDWD